MISEWFKIIKTLYNFFPFTIFQSSMNRFNGIWSKLPQDAYEQPTTDWIPQNEKYRLWYEPAPGPAQIEYKKKTGRPVVLRSKHLQNLAGFDDDEKLY